MADAPLSSDPTVSDVPVTDLAPRPPADVPAPADAPEPAETSEAAELASELSPTQQQVLQLLAGGVGIVQAAETAGVRRRTVSRWVNETPKFIAAFNAWKREQLESGHASALAMTDDIMGTLRNGVREGDKNIAFRMAQAMGMLKVSNPGPIDAGEVERRHRIHQAQVRDELSQAEYQHNLDLHDRAEKDGVAWATWARERLTYHEQSLLKFLRDKLAGRTSGALFLISKGQLRDMLRQAGFPEDQALQLLATYRRPYPGFYEPDDLAYGEDAQKSEEVAAPASDPTNSAESEPPATNA